MTTVQVVETSVTATTASAIHAPPTYDLIWLQGSNRSQMQCYWYALRYCIYSSKVTNNWASKVTRKCLISWLLFEIVFHSAKSTNINKQLLLLQNKIKPGPADNRRLNWVVFGLVWRGQTSTFCCWLCYFNCFACSVPLCLRLPVCYRIPSGVSQEKVM